MSEDETYNQRDIDWVPADADGISFQWIGGFCPVQAEGTVDGEKFYFRARGDAWELRIGEKIFSPEAWRYSETFGRWPDAGWMELDQAVSFIQKAVALYRAGEPSQEG
jgi:hypothetical protein